MLFVTDPSNKDSWKTLADIRKELGSGHWQTSSIFEEIGVSSEFLMSPTSFSLLTENDKAYMIAYQRTKSTMTAYEHHIAMKDHGKKHGGR